MYDINSTFAQYYYQYMYYFILLAFIFYRDVKRVPKVS